MGKVNTPMRTSLYLVRRAEALLGVIRFFSQATSRPMERELQFLAQSDYWDWEMENLIYSFANFAERSRTWRSDAAAINRLKSLGITVSVKLVKQARWKESWQVKQRTERATPAEFLMRVI